MNTANCEANIEGHLIVKNETPKNKALSPSLRLFMGTTRTLDNRTARVGQIVALNPTTLNLKSH
jgi:hypothetical protein